MPKTSQNEHTGQLQQTRCPTKEFQEKMDEVDWSWIREIAAKREAEKGLKAEKKDKSEV